MSVAMCVFFASSAGCKCDRGAPSVAEADGDARPAKMAVTARLRTKVTVQATAMGTRLDFSALTSEYAGEVQIRQALERGIMEIRKVEASMTAWHEDSDVSRINQSAGRKPVRVGADTFAVIDKSLWMSEKSGGAFDITSDVMQGLWAFDGGLDAGVPAAPAV